MSSFRTGRCARALSLMLVAAMLLPLVPCATPSAQAQGGTRTILLFPVVDDSNSGVAGLAKMATSALQMAVDAMPGIECTEFSRTSPLVRRAANEGYVLPTQVETGRVTAQDAIAIGANLHVDAVMLASIQSYRASLMPRSVEVIISGRVYEVEANYNAETGDVRPADELTVAQGFGVVGTSRQLPAYDGGDRALAREALEDAAYRVAKVLGGASISEVTTPKPRKSEHKAARWLGALVALGLIAWAVSASGGGADGLSPEALPPTALPLVVEGQDTIRILWNPPTGTALTVLKYQLQRSVNGGPYAFFGMGGSSANIARDITEYADFDVQPGKSYAYRIRVIYTDTSKVSRWVYFTGVTL